MLISLFRAGPASAAARKAAGGHHRRCMLFRFVFLLLVCSLASFLLICRLELNPRLYIRQWLFSPKPMTVEPLSPLCYNEQTKAYRQPPFANNIVPGIPVWEEFTCYDYAALLTQAPLSPPPSRHFHTTWSLHEHQGFTLTHQATLRSFLATQPDDTQLILWIYPNDEVTLRANTLWQQLPKDRLEYRVYDRLQLLQDTPLTALFDAAADEAAALDENRQENDDSAVKHKKDVVMQQPNADKEQAHQVTTSDETHPDLLRLLVLYRFGGVFFDMPTLFVRDLSPLLEHEWMGQAQCQSSMKGNPFNGGVWHFRPQSPGVCEMIHAAAVHPDRKGASLYYRAYRNILHHGFRPWQTLPWCFTDPSQCKPFNSLRSPLDQLSKDDDFRPKRLDQIFAFRIHTTKPLALPGTIMQYLEQRWPSTS
ncbi:hypothetical protein BC940DRAFT_303696 [Gongronella butleri]|nr:hypothetical protein BC940DRAFT_303696 [Gongronella butleri]